MPPPINLNMTIANGGTLSNIIDFQSAPASWVKWLTIHSPAAFAEVIEVLVAPKASGTFQNLYIGGADVALTAAKMLPLTVPVSWGAMKLQADGAVAAARSFEVTGREDDAR